MTKEELNSLRVRYAPTMLYPPARAAFERALNAKATSETESPRAEAAAEPPLTGGELAALRALGGGLDATQLAEDARYAAEELRKAVRPAYAAEVAQSESEEELAENRNYKRDNAGRFAETGAATHSHKGGRSSKGNPKNPTTQSNTPLKAAPGANTQAQVDAADHALRATEKKGKVMGAAHIDGKPVNIEAGHPDYHGTRHYKKHNKANDTTPRKAARAIGAGKTEPEPGEPDKIRRRHGETNASLAEKKGGNYRFITAHKKK